MHSRTSIPPTGALSAFRIDSNRENPFIRLNTVHGQNAFLKQLFQYCTFRPSPSLHFRSLEPHEISPSSSLSSPLPWPHLSMLKLWLLAAQPIDDVPASGARWNAEKSDVSDVEETFFEVARIESAQNSPEASC